jgi:hypothetical protein
LTYVKSKSRLLLEVQTKNTEDWKKCFETTVTLPESPYLGFTAATGDVSDNHEYVTSLLSSVYAADIAVSSLSIPTLLSSNLSTVNEVEAVQRRKRLAKVLKLHSRPRAASTSRSELQVAPHPGSSLF